MKEKIKNATTMLWSPLAELFGLSRTVALAVVFMLMIFLGFALFWFFHLAPPRVLTITSGPPGSTFETNALQYARILARNGVRLKILHSRGSQENLDRLNDPKSPVEIGFVQSGMTNGIENSKLVALGSIAYQPLLVFYRGTALCTKISDLRGRRLAIGPNGSGTRSLVNSLLELNGLSAKDTNTTYLDFDSAEAARELEAGTIDAAFLMGDSASPQIMRRLLMSQDIRIMDFTQADAYSRRISYLTKLEIPMGGLDFGKNIPHADLHLIGPTVELLARPNLHPALSDLILEAAREVHGPPSILKRKNEFPAPIDQDYPISQDAARFFKSGKGFLYRYLPYWLASVFNRVLVAFVPLVVVLIPTIKAVPALYKWRIRLLIFRWYRALLALERELMTNVTPEQRQELMVRLDRITEGVDKMRVPASFADQFYSLRGHISFVRNRLAEAHSTH